MGAFNDEGWQELQLPSRRQCPKLFYSLSTESDSITLLLTDLICIWECSLDRYDIVAEASCQHTSIDPSASSDQFDVLLSKIGKSLKDGQNVLVRTNERDGYVLRLKTSVDLPKPLRPLEWTFKLTPQPSSELAERILRPSLHEVAVSQEKISTLLRIIREKDHVISRLLDRIGSSAVDLSLIFPGITGVASRKGGHISVTEAKKHVPGMASFDEKSWTKQFANDDGYEGADRTGLGNLVRGCEKCFVHTRAQHEDWIAGLPSMDKLNGDGDKNRQFSPPTRKAAPRQHKSDDESTASGSDDDFERQPTPHRLKSKAPETSKPAKAASVDDGDAEEETVPSKEALKSAPEIGGLGRRNATKAFGTSATRRSSSSSAERPTPLLRRGSDASTATATPTASEDNDDDNDSEPQSSRRRPVKPQPNNKPKLGGLRKKKQATPSPSPTPTPSPAPSPAQASRQQGAPSARGSRNSTSARSKNQVSPTPKDNSNNADETTSTASESDFEIDARARPELDSKPQQPRKSKPEPEPEPDAKPKPNQSQESSANTPRRRLGRIGRKQPDQPTDLQTSPTPRSSKKATDKATSRQGNTHGTRTRDRRGNENDDSDRTGSATSTPSPSPSPSPTASQATSKPKIASHPRKSPSNSAPSRSNENGKRSLESTEPEHEPELQNGGPKKKTPREIRKERERQETEDQKADRRRMELELALAAPSPVKRRRRF
ncbi:hypothetical protein A1O1_06924 [Capronia coronata CBS 617.96]|uniref:Non-homologous end-joining factor 1 n=1 Tax=Capronia coronata CBS 617.96 TaxID=1182541 RepID=W9Y0Y5_9EURO|nr:uncharacterized protein A1O1_06924 [Capronia coronata CBS 617.96]EXJ83305.1 hypothetical protein A1O1_06924 [Capronia coronata CBS 617.96]